MIKASVSIKYLGVMLDKEFHFIEHASYALGKGTKWATQVCCIANTASGVLSALMRLLYKAIVIPRMLYAANIFCANKLTTSSPTSSFIGKMARVIQITRALRSTPRTY